MWMGCAPIPSRFVAKNVKKTRVACLVNKQQSVTGRHDISGQRCPAATNEPLWVHSVCSCTCASFD